MGRPRLGDTYISIGWFRSGCACVGYKSPLPRTPEIFPPKRKHRTLGDSPYMEEARNYKSAVEHSAKLEEKLREDEKKGMVFCSTMGVLKKKYPDQPILIAAMGAIEKQDGGVRPRMTVHTMCR